MKILLATSSIVQRGGGIASYNAELRNALAAGNTFDVLTMNDITESEEYNIVFRCKDYEINNPNEAEMLINSINEQGYDLIINSDSYYIAIIAPFLKAPIISIAHFVNGPLAITAGYNAAYVNNIISLSHYSKDYLFQKFKIQDPDKVAVVYNFVDNDNIPFNYSKELYIKKIEFVYPGGCAMLKSPDIVYKALLKLHNTDLDFKFYWLGDTTVPLVSYSLPKKLTELLPMDKRIIFTGYIPRSEALRIQQQANVFVLPSRGEGCPMTLLEAISAGCIPIVSDARHASREILEDGNFGIITKQGDAESLYKAFVDVINNHEKYKDSYRKTFDYSHSRLSKDSWMSKMISLIESSIQSQKVEIRFDEKALSKSINGYNSLIIKEKIKRKVEHFRYFMFFNTEYLKKEILTFVKRKRLI